MYVIHLRILVERDLFTFAGKLNSPVLCVHGFSDLLMEIHIHIYVNIIFTCIIGTDSLTFTSKSYPNVIYVCLFNLVLDYVNTNFILVYRVTYKVDNKKNSLDIIMGTSRLFSDLSTLGIGTVYTLNIIYWNYSL